MRNETKSINKLYTVCGIIICLCAIAEFIIWIVDASKIHMTNQIVMGSGLLTLTVGVLYYLLVRPRSYNAANWGLWITIVACIVLFFVGVALTPSQAEIAGYVYP